eukprot:TRINITY_DN94208_c0_g1_i1.p1 TRINITY_DN94208_c0_g1~~TRINITY_DN94208_c0_g1_i1.p1  ORF type:complete len:768 (-),score=112.96 TRINITY_DN94208_c0_g1_i1:4-2307(-)
MVIPLRLSSSLVGCLLSCALRAVDAGYGDVVYEQHGSDPGVKYGKQYSQLNGHAVVMPAAWTVHFQMRIHEQPTALANVYRLATTRVPTWQQTDPTDRRLLACFLKSASLRFYCQLGYVQGTDPIMCELGGDMQTETDYIITVSAESNARFAVKAHNFEYVPTAVSGLSCDVANTFDMTEESGIYAYTHKDYYAPDLDFDGFIKEANIYDVPDVLPFHRSYLWPEGEYKEAQRDRETTNNVGVGGNGWVQGEFSVSFAYKQTNTEQHWRNLLRLSPVNDRGVEIGWERRRRGMRRRDVRDPGARTLAVWIYPAGRRRSGRAGTSLHIRTGDSSGRRRSWAGLNHGSDAGGLGTDTWWLVRIAIKYNDKVHVQVYDRDRLLSDSQNWAEQNYSYGINQMLGSDGNAIDGRTLYSFQSDNRYDFVSGGMQDYVWYSTHTAPTILTHSTTTTTSSAPWYSTEWNNTLNDEAARATDAEGSISTSLESIYKGLTPFAEAGALETEGQKCITDAGNKIAAEVKLMEVKTDNVTNMTNEYVAVFESIVQSQTERANAADEDRATIWEELDAIQGSLRMFACAVPDEASLAWDLAPASVDPFTAAPFGDNVTRFSSFTDAWYSCGETANCSEVVRIKATAAPACCAGRTEPSDFKETQDLIIGQAGYYLAKRGDRRHAMDDLYSIISIQGASGNACDTAAAGLVKEHLCDLLTMSSVSYTCSTMCPAACSTASGGVCTQCFGSGACSTCDPASGTDGCSGYCPETSLDCRGCVA